MTAVPAPQNSKPSGWRVAWLLTALAAGLHGWLLWHAGAFCGDEVNVINLAHAGSVAQMTHDSFPVLMPLLIGGWTVLGLAGTDFHLRVLGFLIGLALTCALWLPVWSARRTPPLLSLVFLGLNAMAIYWTDYLRAYGLGSMLILLALAAMCRLLASPTWLRAAILLLAGVLAVQALYQNAAFLAAICCGGWMVCALRRDKGAAMKILVAAVGAAVSLLPYVASVLRWQRATTIRPGFSVAAALDNLHTMLAFPLPQHVWLWALLSLAVIGGAAMVLARPQSAGGEGAGMTAAESRLFAGVTVAAALAGYFIFLEHAALITSPWYFLPLMALGAACFDLGISISTWPRIPRTVAWAILIGTALLCVPFGVRDLNCRYSNMDLVSARLRKEVSPQDYVVVTPWHLGISFSRYYRGQAPWDSLPPVADHSTYRFDLLPATPGETTQAMQPVLEHMARTLQTGHRVWVVGWMHVPAPGRSASTAEARFLAQHTQSFEPVDLKFKGQVNDYENVSLLKASGWRANPP